MKDDEQQDPLDANLAKLIHQDNLPPAPSADEKAAMFAGLKARQAELTRPREVWLQPAILLGAAAAAVLLAYVAIFAEWRPDPVCRLHLMSLLVVEEVIV